MCGRLDATLLGCPGLQPPLELWFLLPRGRFRRFDLLPAVNGGDSCRAAHAAPRGVPGSLATARACPGLTLPPQAFCVSASPAATRMLRAAFASRSWTTPHAWQAQARMLSGLGPS